MTTVGQMSQLTDDETGKYEGLISTLTLDVRFEMHPVAQAGNPNHPTHEIVVPSRSGRPVRVGSAWLRTSTRGERSGFKFFSLSFDDPSMPQALNVAAFRRDGCLLWDVTWKRRAIPSAA